MDENLELERGPLPDEHELLAGELPRQNDARETEPGGRVRAGARVHARLGGEVQAQAGKAGAGDGDEPQVGEDDRVRPQSFQDGQEVDRLGQLGLLAEGVERNVDFFPEVVGVGDEPGDLRQGEIFRFEPRIEFLEPEIYGAGAQGREKRLGLPGRRDALATTRPPPPKVRPGKAVVNEDADDEFAGKCSVHCLYLITDGRIERFVE